MARVCIDWFPETDGFYMDDRLKMQLDILLKNITKDWDFTILITGQGEVRVGKSVLALQVCMYWTYEIWKRYNIKNPFTIKDNIVFEGKKLIKQGNLIGQNYKYSTVLFDEAGADLEGKKVLTGSTREVLDYFRECGQYNLLNVLVIPEFFDLPKGIALTRSICLLDVFYTPNEEGIFQRGFFNFYSKRSKKLLYLLGKKELDYSKVKSDFKGVPGRFMNFYPINEAEYRKAKQDALIKRESLKKNKWQIQRDALIYLLAGENREDTGKPIYNQTQLAQRMEEMTGIEITSMTIHDVLKRWGIEEEEIYSNPYAEE